MKNKPLFVVLESPFAGPTLTQCEANKTYAKAALLHSLTLGEVPFMSHLLYTQVLDDTIPAHRELGISANLQVIRRADLVAVYHDRGISAGMQRAIDFARANRIPVVFRQINTR